MANKTKRYSEGGQYPTSSLVIIVAYLCFSGKKLQLVKCVWGEGAFCLVWRLIKATVYILK